MDLPDYTAATAAVDLLGADHHGQHRCTDGVYYTPSQWASCPLNVALATVNQTLATARNMSHTACHTPEHVLTVAQAMCTDPDDQPVDLMDLDGAQAGWWLSRARLALETNAALLDPDLVQS